MDTQYALQLLPLESLWVQLTSICSILKFESNMAAQDKPLLDEMSSSIVTALPLLWAGIVGTLALGIASMYLLPTVKLLMDHMPMRIPSVSA